MNFEKWPIEAFIFDMDGTLFNTERLYRDMWFKLAPVRGFYIDDAMLDQMRGASIEYGSAVFEARNPGYSYREEREIRMEEVFRYVDANGVPKMPGCDETLKWLKAHGYKIAIGSSTRSAQVHHYLHDAGMEETFDFVGCGDLTTHGKPEPDLFLICAERLGVDPRACVVVEDSMNGIKAGHAAGSYVLGIPDMNDLTALQDLCDAQLASLDRIIPWLEGLPKEISGLQ